MSAEFMAALHTCALRGLACRIREIIGQMEPTNRQLFALWGAAVGNPLFPAPTNLPPTMLKQLFDDAMLLNYWFAWDGEKSILVPIKLRDPDTNKDWENLFIRYVKELQKP